MFIFTENLQTVKFFMWVKVFTKIYLNCKKIINPNIIMEMKMDRVKDLEDFKDQYYKLLTNSKPRHEINIIVKHAENPFVQYFNKAVLVQHEEYSRVEKLFKGVSPETVELENVVSAWLPEFGQTKILNKEK